MNSEPIIHTAFRRASSRSRRGPVLSAVFAACAFALAPDATEAQAMIGLRAGMSKTNVYGDEIGSGGFRTGFLAGGWMRFPLGHIVSLQLEANLAQKGFKESVEGSSAGLKLSYLDLPLLLQLTKRENSIQGVFSIGGAFGLNRSCTAFLTSAAVSAEVECDALGSNAVIVEDWEISLVFGTALEFDGGPFIFGLAFRGQVGATDAMSVLIDDVNFEYARARNGAFELQATIGVPIR